MTEWGVVTVIIALFGFIVAVVKPIMSLTKSITSLTVEVTGLREDLKEQKKDLPLLKYLKMRQVQVMISLVGNTFLLKLLQAVLSPSVSP